MTAHSQLRAAITSLQGKYSLLLAAFLVFFLAGPLVDTFFVGERPGDELFDLLSLVLLFTALYTVSGMRTLLIVAGLLSTPATVGRLSLYFTKNSALFEIGDGFSFLALAVLAISILRQVLEAKRVSLDVVQGAVCVYILLGAAWAYLFSFVETFYPGSFQLPPLLATSALPVVVEARQRFVYYSFVTLTT